jgi:hypothetical protein
MNYKRSPIWLAGLLIASPLFAATPQLTEKVAVNGAFGAAPEQYGRANLGASPKTVRFVNCFAGKKHGMVAGATA